MNEINRSADEDPTVEKNAEEKEREVKEKLLTHVITIHTISCRVIIFFIKANKIKRIPSFFIFHY